MTLHKRNVAKGGIVPAISLSTEFEPGKNFRDFLMQSAQMRGNFSAPSLLEQDPHTGEDLL
jgi:hypothetical protein